MFHPPTSKHIYLICSYLFFFHSPIPTGDTFGCVQPRPYPPLGPPSLNPSLFINSSFATDPQPCLRIPQVRVCLKQSLSRPTSKPKLPTDVLPVPDGRVARRTTRPRHPKPRRKRLKKQKKKIRKSRPVVVVLEKNRHRPQLLGKRPNWRLLGTKPPQGLLLFRQALVLYPHPRHSQHKQHRLRHPSLLKLLSLRLHLFIHLLLLLFQHTPRHTLKVPIHQLLLLPIPCRNNTRLGHSRNLRHLNPLKLLLARVVRTLIPFDPLLTILLLRLPIVRLLSMWYHPGTTIAPARRPRSLVSLTRRRKVPTLSKHHCTARLPVMSRPYTLQRLLPRHQHLPTTL